MRHGYYIDYDVFYNTNSKSAVIEGLFCVHLSPITLTFTWRYANYPRSWPQPYMWFCNSFLKWRRFYPPSVYAPLLISFLLLKTIVLETYAVLCVPSRLYIIFVVAKVFCENLLYRFWCILLLDSYSHIFEGLFYVHLCKTILTISRKYANYARASKSFPQLYMWLYGFFFLKWRRF